MNANNGGNWEDFRKAEMPGKSAGNPEPEVLDGDISRVVALLNGMPRVAAPKDFDARLMARIAEAKSEAREFGALKNLLADLPAATAPADFDFKLRARIAQARSAESAGFWSRLSSSFNESFGGLRFSMVQASAALLIVGAIVSGVTYKFLSSPTTVKSESPQIASVTPGNTDIGVKGMPNGANAGSSAQVAQIGDVPSSRVARPRSSHLQSGGIMTASYRPPVSEAAPVVEASDADASAVMIKHSGNGSTRMVSSVSYGMQNAVARQNAGRTSRDELATQVF